MRFLPLSNDDRLQMMQETGIKDIEELFLDIPSEIRSNAISKIDLPAGLSERRVLTSLKSLAKENTTTEDYASFLGAGAYKHYIPALVSYIVSRGEFLTSYTPYQPEVAQGTLQILFEFQTQVAKIMGLDVANASMYDGASASAEAVAMALRINKKKKILISGGVHPYFTDTIKTFVKHLDTEIIVNKFDPVNEEDLISQINDELSCVVVQNPDFAGRVSAFNGVCDKCKQNNVIFIVTGAEPLALGVIKSPGEIGADIACYEGMGLCGNLNFGGPSLGLFSCKKEFVRQMPGRIIGQTVDKEGKQGFVLTLATREQHIRRDKATSNICSNAGLMATAFSIHLAMLGGIGFKNLSKLNHSKAGALYQKIRALKNVKVLNKTFFNEFLIELPISAEEFVKKSLERELFAGVPLSKFYKGYDNVLIVCATECTATSDIENLVSALEEI